MIARRIFMIGLAACLAAAPTLAHGPTPQKAEQSIEIAAAPDMVWNLLSNPAAYGEWHPDISSVVMDGEGAGAKRTIGFTSGGSLIEGIDRIDEDGKNIRWRLSQEDIEVFPASYYTHSVKVEGTGAGSVVTWSASFFRADTTNEPLERHNDEAAIAAVKELASHGLEGLRSHFETGG